MNNQVEITDYQRYGAHLTTFAIVLLALFIHYLIGLMVLKTYNWTFPEQNVFDAFRSDQANTSTLIILLWPFPLAFLTYHFLFVFLPKAAIESNKKKPYTPSSLD